MPNTPKHFEPAVDDAEFLATFANLQAASLQGAPQGILVPVNNHIVHPPGNNYNPEELALPQNLTTNIWFQYGKYTMEIEQLKHQLELNHEREVKRREQDHEWEVKHHEWEMKRREQDHEWEMQRREQDYEWEMKRAKFTAKQDLKRFALLVQVARPPVQPPQPQAEDMLVINKKMDTLIKKIDENHISLSKALACIVKKPRPNVDTRVVHFGAEIGNDSDCTAKILVVNSSNKGCFGDDAVTRKRRATNSHCDVTRPATTSRDVAPPRPGRQLSFVKPEKGGAKQPPTEVAATGEVEVGRPFGAIREAVFELLDGRQLLCKFYVANEDGFAVLRPVPRNKKSEKECGHCLKSLKTKNCLCHLWVSGMHSAEQDCGKFIEWGNWKESDGEN